MAVAAAIAAAAVAANGGALRASFVALDDDEYVYGNAHVLAGLTRESVAWAFGIDGRSSYFHPVTWLSLMLDRTLFGTEAWGFHLHNVLLHAGNAVLLLLVLRRATGRLAAPAGAALLLAVHPVGVEAVAWVTERKTLLSAFFGLSAVLAHVALAARPGARRLALVTVLFAASLLAKPAFMALPLLLLVLDWWPLRRLDREGGGGTRGSTFPPVPLRTAIVEKLPLVAVSAASLAVSLLTTRERALEKSVGLAPWQPWAQSRLGDLRFRRGLVGEAEAAFREALRWDPNSADALFGLSELLRKTGRGEEARPFYARYASVRAAARSR